MPEQRHPLLSLSNTTKNALKRSASAMSRQQRLPRRLRKLLSRLSQNRQPSRVDNRRKKITPELQEFIKNLGKTRTRKKIQRNFRELCHYAYVFDIKHYKSQLEAEEAEKLQGIGDVILHYCTSGSKRGIDPSKLFETDNYRSKYPCAKESELNPMAHFFKIGIHEKKFSMDNIHFMRKIADIKRPDLKALNPVRENLKTKKVGVFLHIFYPELGETIASYLKNIPCNIDIFISTRQESVQPLRNVLERLNNATKVEDRHICNIV